MNLNALDSLLRRPCTFTSIASSILYRDVAQKLAFSLIYRAAVTPPFILFLTTLPPPVVIASRASQRDCGAGLLSEEIKNTYHTFNGRLLAAASCSRREERKMAVALSLETFYRRLLCTFRLIDAARALFRDI